MAEWKLQCPKKKADKKDPGRLWLVFPNGAGNIETNGNIRRRGLIAAVSAAGLTMPVLDEQQRPKRDEDGKPIREAKYTGLHSLRHFYASWCINRVQDGGLELPPKIVQERLGHSTIAITLDLYGHLFPRGDDTEELAKGELALLQG